LTSRLLTRAWGPRGRESGADTYYVIADDVCAVRGPTVGGLARDWDGFHLLTLTFTNFARNNLVREWG
jgi:hypothetical protein